MTMTDPKNTASKDDIHDLQQNSSVTDKNHKDRPGTRAGVPPTNDDYDYRPDYGDTGGSADQEEGKVLDGQPVDQKSKPEGDKPEDIHKPAEKWEKSKT
jgi:hypothetical protein